MVFTASQRMLLNYFHEPLRSMFEHFLTTKDGRAKIARSGIRPMEVSLAIIAAYRAEPEVQSFKVRYKMLPASLARAMAMVQLLEALGDASEQDSADFKNYFAKVEELRVTLESQPREAER